MIFEHFLRISKLHLRRANDSLRYELFFSSWHKILPFSKDKFISENNPFHYTSPENYHHIALIFANQKTGISLLWFTLAWLACAFAFASYLLISILPFVSFRIFGRFGGILEFFLNYLEEFFLLCPLYLLQVFSQVVLVSIFILLNLLTLNIFAAQKLFHSKYNKYSLLIPLGYIYRYS